MQSMQVLFSNIQGSPMQGRPIVPILYVNAALQLYKVLDNVQMASTVQK